LTHTVLHAGFKRMYTFFFRKFYPSWTTGASRNALEESLDCFYFSSVFYLAKPIVERGIAKASYPSVWLSVCDVEVS